MKSELDRKLCESHPRIFQHRNSDPTQTLMCWGFDVGDGWYHIIDAACRMIQSHVDQSVKSRAWTIEHNHRVDADPGYRCRDGQPYARLPVPDEVDQVIAVQVKEKYGTLRFYCTGSDDYTRGVLDMAESMSAVTCERCGSPGEIRYSGWMKTLCDQHHMDQEFSADPSFLP